MAANVEEPGTLRDQFEHQLQIGLKPEFRPAIPAVMLLFDSWFESFQATQATQSLDPSESRKTVLLEACLNLLIKCGQGPYVKNALRETVFYDGVDCDGGCLANDIAAELGKEEVF